MMHAPDPDEHSAYKAEEAINRFLQQHPDSVYAPIAKQSLLDVQENLALGVFGVGQFLQEKRGKVLFQPCGVLEKSRNCDVAAICYGKIVSDFPFSKHVDEAKQS